MIQTARSAFLFSTLFLAFAAKGETSPEIRVGFLPPVTGIEMPEGVAQKKALDLAVKQINAGGGVRGKKIKIIVEDSKSSPQGALEAVEKLIDKEKVQFIVGPLKSAQIQAFSPKVQKSNVPTTIGGTNPKLTSENNKWLFRVRPSDSITAAAMMKFVKEDLKVASVGIVHDNGAFGYGGANLVEKNSKELGIKIVKRVGFDTGLKDQTANLKALKDAGAQVVIMYIANLADVIAVESAHGALGRPFTLVGSPSAIARLAIEGAKEASEGVIGVADMVLGTTDANRKLVEDYRKEYKEEPDALQIYTYDGMKILAAAINEVGEDPNKVRDWILARKGWTGVMGDYHFDANGDGLHSVSLVKVEGGKLKLLKVVDVRAH